MSKLVKTLLALWNTILVIILTLFFSLINAELGSDPSDSTFTKAVYPAFVLVIALISIAVGWYVVFRKSPTNFALKILMSLPYLLVLVIVGIGLLHVYA